GVESAVGCFFPGLLRLPRVPGFVLAVNAPCPDFSEPRVLFYLYPPSLVIYQVPVEDIKLMHGEDVNVFLYELLVEEMPADIEVHSSPPEARVVCYADTGDGPYHPFFLAV